MHSGSVKNSKIPAGMAGIRVVHVLPFMDFGGVESHRVTLGRHLDAEEKTTTLFCSLNGLGRAASRLEEIACRVLSLGENPKIPNARLLGKLWALFIRTRPRLVHAALPEANFHAVLAARLAGVPFVWVEETGEIQGSRSPLAHWVLGWIYRLADRVLCVSHAVERGVLSSMPMLRGKTRILYNPLPCPETDSVAKDRPFHFLAACRLVPEKNLPLLFRALEILKNQGVACRCLIAGEGPLRQELGIEVNRRGLQQMVEWSDQGGGLEGLFPLSEFFVNTSSREGLGLAPMEALAAGLPVVATRVGGVPEWLEPSGGGWLVPPDDAEALAAALERALRLSPVERQAVARRGADYLRSQFSVEKYRAGLRRLAQETGLRP